MVDESWLLFMLLLTGNGELLQLELETYLSVATPADFNLVLPFPGALPHSLPVLHQSPARNLTIFKFLLIFMNFIKSNSP
jgi:hypothetical protein